MMWQGIVQDIQAALRRIEQQATLWVETNFVERVHAIDRLEWHILERIENVLYEHGYQQELARLYQQAQHVWHQLDAVNARLFCRLRGQLVSGEATGAMLPQMFATYVSQACDDHHQDLSGYDCLDVFVNGVLDIRHAPEETKPLETGMIGYHPTPVRVILALLGHVHLSATDVFYDVGAGLGRVALLAGLLSAAQVKGIEFEPAYCAYAQERADSLRLSRVSFLNVDARAADYTDGTVFFLYTPFTGRMFQAVVDRLHSAARADPVTIAAYGPCTEPMAQQPWAQLTVLQAFGHDTLALFTRRERV
jgi:hypothetical protein